ncbi:hypothetical protein LG632_24895, partial [Streptomyces sp. SMC 277]|nr:hypothetical protein [Streptomyces antimicrobicus]
EVTALEYEDAAGAGAAQGAQAAAEEVYHPQPLDEDTGSYGIQSFAPAAQAGQPDPAQTAAFGSPFGMPEQDSHQYAAYYDPQGQGGYDYGQQQTYAAYSDPYIGTGGGVAQPYGGYPQYTDPQYATDTPPGGVWVPQQRDADAPYPQAQPYPGQEPQYPHPQGYPYQGTGEYEQYRY